MDEYVCVTMTARAGEAAPAFGQRLTAFWTHLLRSRPEEYARVYAETSRFGTEGGRITRQYFVGAEVISTLASEWAAAGLDHDPIDADELFSKYEATPPDWFQIPH